MLENLFTNVFGRPKNKSSSNRSQDSTGSNLTGQASSSAQMTGPFSVSSPQMPQPPHLPYPPAPYPGNSAPTNYYPSLPFSQPNLPGAYGSNSMPTVPGASPYCYPANTMVRPHVSPLDSVPFETKLTLNDNSANSVSLEQLFKEIKKAADVVDRADAYLKSNQSDYDFKTEQGLIYQ